MKYQAGYFNLPDLRPLVWLALLGVAALVVIALAGVWGLWWLVGHLEFVP